MVGVVTAGLGDRAGGGHEISVRLGLLVGRLAASPVAKPRVSTAAGKALFYRQLETGIAAAYEDAGQTMACNMMTPEALEGVQAFIDKRAPNWG